VPPPPPPPAMSLYRPTHTGLHTGLHTIAQCGKLT
jgi:hypothetical protein